MIASSAGFAASASKTVMKTELPATNGVVPTDTMKDTLPSPDTNWLEALVAAGNVPEPMLPLTDPVTVKEVLSVKATVMLCGTAAEVSTSEPTDEPDGLVLGEAGSAPEPRSPLSEPV